MSETFDTEAAGAEAVRASLAKLPDTPDEIANYLRERNMIGRRYSATQCPIARYLREDTGVSVHVGPALAVVGDIQVMLPSWVGDFIVLFDAYHQYSDLLDRGTLGE